MMNKYFQDEEIAEDDLYFMCFMIERVARNLQQRNRYVVNAIGKEELRRLISSAKALQRENLKKVEEEWIKNYKLDRGDFDIADVDKELVDRIPRSLDMGAVYQRLILDTLDENEDCVDGIMRVYNNEICETIDNYNCSAFYEPSYVIARAYFNGGF